MMVLNLGLTRERYGQLMSAAIDPSPTSATFAIFQIWQKQSPWWLKRTWGACAVDQCASPPEENSFLTPGENVHGLDAPPSPNRPEVPLMNGVAWCESQGCRFGSAVPIVDGPASTQVTRL